MKNTESPIPAAFLHGTNNLVVTLLAALDKLNAPQDVKDALTENGDVEHVAWWIETHAGIIAYRSKTEAYVFEVSPERYAKFKDAVKRWYEPVRVMQNAAVSNAVNGSNTQTGTSNGVAL